jgi:Zn-dependent M28 family amino/carboxypeptidase
VTVTNAVLTPAAARTPQATLREVIEHLAPMERRAGSEGEREAAEWIAQRLTAAGAPARVEDERYLAGYPQLTAKLTALGTAAGLAALTRRGRLVGIVGGATVAALVADDASNGLRAARRLVGDERTTWNVVAETGDPDAERTLVVLAHHDAAPTGRAFDPTLQRALGERFPGIVERIDKSLPQWWGVVGSPALTAAGAATGRRRLVAAGAALSALATAAMADIARSPIVPGANDNLSAVAVLVALAEALRDRPVKGIRVVLASMGAEEVLQGGIHGFAKRHLATLDRERTWVLNPDTVGSPSLVLLEGEGTVVMEDYFDRTFRDLVARVADTERIPMRRGMRARASTDAVIPSRMGIPTASITSLDRYKALSNYHLISDTPEKVCYPTVALTTDLAEAVARELADRGG